MGALKRIGVSNKVHKALAGLIAAMIAVYFPGNYTPEILTLITIVTGLLVGGQVAQDFKHGSPSDGTTG